MKRIIVTLSFLLAMMAVGTGLKAQEVTISLKPGWNWISYPNAVSMNIEDAFGAFIPEEGDRIKSMTDYSSYSEGEWGATGDLEEFEPGQGYMYYSSRTEVTSFVFAQASSSVTVTTSEPVDITINGVTCGGVVNDGGDVNVIVRGVCWSTSQPPTVADPHTTDGYGTGGFTTTIEGLEMNTTYYVRAYAVTDDGLAYGETLSFSTLNGIPVVTTAEVTVIMFNRATCGGTLTSDGGLETVRGVCWGTSSNPTVSDSHTTDGTGTGKFVSALIGLEPNTTYYVRAYASNSYVTVYGNQRNFTTPEFYVDLGLPSGLLWAPCNLGADNPEDYGDYFAWGDTQPKGYYDWSTYQYCNGDYNTLTKYCSNSSYGYNGFTDDLTALLPEDDAATANWGVGWRMPTKAEWEELYNNTTVTWTTLGGVNGHLFTASNGNSIFLPAAGYRWWGELYYAGSFGYYWSSSLHTGHPCYAWHFHFNSDRYIMDPNYRGDHGYTVRPVRSVTYVIDTSANPAEGGTIAGGGTYEQSQTCTLTATANTDYIFVNWTENGEVVSTDATYTFTVTSDRTIVANFTANVVDDHAYVDLGLPSGLLWATCNVGADNSEDCGDYFAWGETTTKETYDWSTYQYCNGGDGWNTLTKYCNDAEYGYNGFTDNLTTLLPEDNAATANWGEGWRMPTKAEWEELYNNTTVTWTTQGGVNGRLFTASNGNSLFLPAAGYRWDDELYLVGSYSYYWSSSLYTDYPSGAWYFYFDSGYYYIIDGNRNYGFTVRPVHSSQH